MAEQIICTVHRTDEHGDTFRGCYTLTYFGPFVFVQALSGTYSRKCRAELIALFKTKPHLTHYWYIRKKRGRYYIFKKPIYPNSPDKPGLFIFQE
jgi:hypothetical protein